MVGASVRSYPSSHDAPGRHARQRARALSGQRGGRAAAREDRHGLRDRRHPHLRRHAGRGVADADRRQARLRQGNRGRAARRRSGPRRPQQQGHARRAARRAGDRRRPAARGRARCGRAPRRRREGAAEGRLVRQHHLVRRAGVAPRRHAAPRHEQRPADRAAGEALPGGVVRAHSRQPRHAAAEGGRGAVRRARPRVRGAHPAGASRAHLHGAADSGVRARARPGHHRGRGPRRRFTRRLRRRGDRSQGHEGGARRRARGRDQAGRRLPDADRRVRPAHERRDRRGGGRTFAGRRTGDSRRIARAHDTRTCGRNRGGRRPAGAGRGPDPRGGAAGARRGRRHPAVKQPAVYLIGAGPGDPGLITVHGLNHLRAADVVVYDDLVPSRLLKYARQGAELINVGIASPQSMGQDAIGYLLVEKAREGKLVARLKFGDPFVFEPGGAEALFLHEHHVPFEVVPGLVAGLATPAYAGVPVTYPGGGDTITLVRGFEDESRTPPDIDWASLARLEGTVVCYAGSQQLPQLLEALISHGWPAGAQAAVIYNGTLPSQVTVSGTMQELLELTREHTRSRRPAILVAGRVAGLREHLRWYDSRPLFGKRVLVTRPREQAPELVDRLTALGAESIEAPMIRMGPPEDPDPLLRAAARPEDFDWIVFTSANAVDAFMTALLDGERDVRALKGPRLCTSGTATADRLAAYGIKVDLIPREFRSDAVAAALLATGSLKGVRVLLPRADIGREVIAEQLREAGAA